MTKQVGPDLTIHVRTIDRRVPHREQKWRWKLKEGLIDRPTEQKCEIHKSIVTVYKNEMASASESWASLFVRQLFDIIMVRERKKKRTKT